MSANNKFSLVLFLVLALAGCGGGGGGGSSGATGESGSSSGTDSDDGTTGSVPPVTTTVTDDEAAAFLVRGTFGPTEDDIAKVVEIGFEAWVDEQIALPQTLQTPLFYQQMAQAGLGDSVEASQVYQLLHLRMDTWWQLAIKAPDQLRQRVAFALSEIFVVSDNNDQLVTAVNGITDYHDLLASYAFGNYRELLEAVTLHPVMGTYLSMRGNQKSSEYNNIRPDENYAREAMQLFSIGLVQLNQDGTVNTDAQGNPIPTYGQDEIKGFARVYTGWNFFDAEYIWTYAAESEQSFTTPMRAFEDYHETGEKLLLDGEVIPAGGTAESDLELAMDNIFQHPNVAPFISRQLIQRLVTSNPSAAYTGRVAAVFNDNGAGERGDLGAVVKAILLDEEAFISGEQYGGAKLKEPLLRLSQLWRAFDAEGDEGVYRYAYPEYDLGQRPYGSPSVFNFFRPHYTRPGPIESAGLVAPEFEILTDSTVVATSNRLRMYILPGYYYFGSGLDAIDHGISLDFSDELALADDVEALLDHLDTLLLAGRMPDTMRESLLEMALQIPLGDDGGEDRVTEVIAMIITSPEFAVQR